MCCASLLEAAIEGTKGDAMRKLRIFEHISLDGVIEISGGAGDDDFPYGDWTAPYRTPEGFAMVTAIRRLQIFRALTAGRGGTINHR